MMSSGNERFSVRKDYPVNLLAHFSPFAKKVLVEEGNDVLCIPDINQSTVRHVLHYMYSGEKEKPGFVPIKNLSAVQLYNLQRACDFLQYESMKRQVVGIMRERAGEEFTSNITQSGNKAIIISDNCNDTGDTAEGINSDDVGSDQVARGGSTEPGLVCLLCPICGSLNHKEAECSCRHKMRTACDISLRLIAVLWDLVVVSLLLGLHSGSSTQQAAQDT